MHGRPKTWHRQEPFSDITGALLQLLNEPSAVVRFPQTSCSSCLYSLIALVRTREAGARASYTNACV